jgi:hypothetical protein
VVGDVKKLQIQRRLYNKIGGILTKEYRIEIRYKIDDVNRCNQDIITITVRGDKLNDIYIERNGIRLLMGDRNACNDSVQHIVFNLILKYFNEFAGSKSFVSINEIFKDESIINEILERYGKRLEE